jgi:Fe-S cluster assembly ATP-binding protein
LANQSALEIENLKVKVEDKTILNGISLRLEQGERSFIFGPNGSGKSTLLKTIMGIPSYVIESGSIKYNGIEITGMNVFERSKLGITMAFQQPPEIRGVKLSQMLKLCLGKKRADKFSSEEMDSIEKFRLTEFLERDVNVGFSGGERKRAEILQILFLKPSLILLDEPDSGVDVDSLKLLSEELDNYLRISGASSLIITHKGDILDYIRAERACVVMDGVNHCFPDPRTVYAEIRAGGYEHCLSCSTRVQEESS